MPALVFRMPMPTYVQCQPRENCHNAKKAIRIISHATYNAHTAPLFAHHQIMPYMSIIKQSKISFMHSYHFNYAPLAFGGTWVTNANRGSNHELRNVNDYYIPMANTNHMARFPAYQFGMGQGARFVCNLFDNIRGRPHTQFGMGQWARFVFHLFDHIRGRPHTQFGTVQWARFVFLLV
jgi:hypothetical protein